MVFAIYEQGLRIHTPKEKLLARPAIRQTQAISASRRLMEHGGDAEHEQSISDQQYIRDYPERSGQGTGERAAPRHKAMEAYASVEQARKPAAPLLPAHQIMRTPVITLSETASLNEAWAIMKRESIHYLLLLDEKGGLSGVINDRDLLQEAAGIGPLSQEAGIDLAHTPAARLIRAPLVTASPDTDVRDIARVMLAQKVRAMPVVSEEGELLGLVTRSDLMLGLANQNLEIWT
ncbi:CBS domain-containing protein [Marinospirillum alkaliphilum]|uniref:CBS domain-containing protein n=1 Tax=Marinospirillum alkaliphilum DSM 21637 TaxID=1122209 RepID=A0A1K1W0T1_9GAMM|nr:CBS domain-containing protein [Marinospirillum alkaliphilum]SFX31022.1 CBS domain-containing protein [Marinospirillum alkaliphilum DSM 21637]